MNEFGKLLRSIRYKNNELLKDMADKLDCSVSFLSAIENDRKKIPLDFPKRIAEIYKENEKSLSTAAKLSMTEVKIDMSNYDYELKKLVLAFTDNASKLSETSKDRVNDIIEKTKEEQLTFFEGG